MLARNGTHKQKLGRTSEFSVGGNLDKGIESILQTAKNTAVGAGVNESSSGEGTTAGDGEQEHEIDEDDLMLEMD